MELLGSWSDILRVLVTTATAYVGLVLILRVSGKRTLAKMNAFDFVVTVALGSTLATTILSRDVTWGMGMVALGSLVALQYLVSWLGFRWRIFRRAVTASPTLLVYRGEMLDEETRKERVTRGEIEEAVRSAGLATLEEAHAVVLETTGDLTVLPPQEDPQRVSVLDSTSNLHRLQGRPP